MRIGLLGGVEAAVEAGPDGAASVVPLGGVRLRGLLARLALDAGRPVTSTALVDDLWGATPPEGAANALQALVSRLRRAIGADRVRTDARGYRLHVDPDDVDALRFGALVAAAGEAPAEEALAGLRAALGLWRGPALADVAELPFAPSAIARLTDRKAAAVEQAARLALRLGDMEAELDGLAALLDAAPLRESTAALLARCLLAADRQADALAVLDRTRARLVEELGVDPGAELVAARLAVLRHDGVRVEAPPPRRTAAALTSFVGRDRDVTRLRALVATSRLVTLTGPGGAGKTRLAREVCTETQGMVAELAALTSGDQLPAALLSTVGGAELVLRNQDDADSTSRLLAALAGRDLLLVLDNCEHIIDTVAALAERLLAVTPGLRVLATSREPLGVPGEVLHPVAALADDDAVRLFADRAAAVSPEFTLTTEAAPVVLEICRRLDGQPLPIELAAARTRTLSPAEIAARLDDRFRLLTSGARTALPRHQTLRAVVDWSWDLLAEPERAVARRLGAFAGGATLAAAERVCASAVGPRRDDVFDLLSALVDKSLVVAVPQPGGAPTRYRMLETIRAYAVEKLDEAGERAAALAAHAEVVLELVETAEPHLRGAEQLVWLPRLRAESDEIDIALRRAVTTRDAPTAHRLLAGMGWSWIIRGLADVATRWSAEIEALDGPVPPAVRARTRTMAALAAIGRGDVAAAKVQTWAAVDLADGLPRPLHPVLQLLRPVYLLYAEDDGTLLSALAAESEDTWVQAFALMVQAQFAENEGLIDLQRKLVRRAHQLFLEVGDRFGLGMVLHTLGELEELSGALDSAALAYDEAISLGEELGNLDDVPQFLMRRAIVDGRRGDLEAARRGLRDVLTRCQDGALLGGVGIVHIALAHLERLLGNIGEARAQLELAAQADQDVVPAPQRNVTRDLGLAGVEMTVGDLDAARAALLAALNGAVEAVDGPVSAAVAEAVARYAVLVADHEPAARALGIALRQRGALDLGNQEVVEAVEAVQAALGPAADPAVAAGRAVERAAGLTELADYLRGAPAGRRAVSPAAPATRS